MNLLKNLSIIAILIIAQATSSQKLVILHTNDMHSMVTGFGPELAYSPTSINDDKTVGGFARLATILKNEKAKFPKSTLIVDAGDFLMGTLFHTGEEKFGFQIPLMKKMGYDLITIGNHELDFGPASLAKIINSSLKTGEIPEIIASNMVFSAEDKTDDELEKLFTKKHIKKYTIIKKNGLKIGIIGLMGKEADEVVPTAKPLTFSKQIKAVKTLTNKLKKEDKVDLVILLSHTGFYPSEKGGYEGEDIDIAKKVKNLDIIISGHTHVKVEKPIKINNTIIVQTGEYAHNLGRLEIDVKNKQIEKVNYSLIPVNDKVMGDIEINKMIDDYRVKIENTYLKPIGLTFLEPIAEAKFTVKRNSHITKKVGTVGKFVTDAMKYYIDKHSDNVDMVVEASGPVRESILKGKITTADMFRVSPLGSGLDETPGYSIAKLYITGKELKGFMEVVVKTQGTVGTDSYLHYSGIKIDVDMSKGLLKKVQKVYVNGKEIDISKKNEKLYSIAASTYILSFLGRIKKMTFGLVKVVPKDAKGNPITDMNKQLIDFDKNKKGIQEGKIWLALIEYLKTFKDTDNNGLVEIPTKYKQ